MPLKTKRSNAISCPKTSGKDGKIIGSDETSTFDWTGYAKYHRGGAQTIVENRKDNESKL